MGDVFIQSVGMTNFGKLSSNFPQLLLEASENALEEVSVEEIEAIYLGSMNPDEFVEFSSLPAMLSDELGLVPKSAVRIDNSSASGSATILQAYLAVKSGYFETVLCVGGEKMTEVTTKKAGRILAKVLSPLERRLGLTMPALAALACRAYMDRYGLSRDQLSTIPIKNHHNSIYNPYAHFQKEIKLETVNKSRLVVDPLRLYDCSPMSDGAAALILSKKPGPVKIIGIGNGTDYLTYAHRDSLTSSTATKSAAKKAFDQAKIEPNQIDVAELHDAFSILEIINSEDIGFFRSGQGGIAAERNDTSLNGTIPINPSGGLKARGHPVGATGIAQVMEIFWQLTQNAENRQVDGVKRGLTQNIGGFASNNVVTIMEAVQ